MNTSSLIKEYEQTIDDLIAESEHNYRLTIDYDLLDVEISRLIVCAKKDGIEEALIWNIIHKKLPSYINYKNYHNTSRKKAA